MDKNHVYSSFKDFILFLYVYMALSDGHLDDTEEEVILKKMTRLFPKDTEHKTKYLKFKDDYEQLSSDDVDYLVKNNFDNFPNVTFTDKYRVYREMFDIINADGVIDESETEAMDKLKDIIDYDVKKSIK